MEGERIKEITAFVVRVADTPDGYSQWPEYAADSDRVQSVFQRFGLPDHLDRTGGDEFSPAPQLYPHEYRRT